ncbi:MAG TPA: L-serine ammonia-lyase, iron-sulfur-dependent, subunit alpha [Lachnospiraceae bacterium]|nr:L-serine ammonia-lyase, iron-sulfur-dependent, subunit alpha [Lachnospiraceae bacterium]HIS60752.1 L-serine ammonia-lyase, iron-sulfur-dependent, subunit alpha [Candidatus Scybalomonas excrementigallinarum]
MNFRNGKELLSYCEEKNCSISEAMIKREVEDIERPLEETMEKMHTAWDIMKKSVERSLTEDVRSMGGLIGGESKKINQLREDGKNICGSVISKAIAYAVGVLEVNASMGLIVAAPTAGSSGVMPGTMLAMQQEHGFSDEEIVKALFNASAIGYLVTRNATTAGAEGGCQAEVGSASAMAASAVVELMGGTPKQCLDAASFAIINLLGLVCDPVGGLVEFPCQLRNAQGATTALTSAEMSLSGITCPAPIDETIDIMYSVGKAIPSELRETSLGGMATSKGACSRCNMCH